MPLYNVERFVAQAVQSVLDQTFDDFELLIVDDCSPDASAAICAGFADPRIRLLRNPANRGLAGARNTGIRHARGEYLAFLDSDDSWHPEKLARHVRHLDARPGVGVSFSRSAFMSPDGQPTGYFQMPRLHDIDAGYLLCRNPVGNGSAAVVRREVFEAIRFEDDLHGRPEDCYFDERFRRSEDIECWVRIALTTAWCFEGLAQPLTLYRLNAAGLSASLYGQLDSWEAMIAKLRRYSPEILASWERPARAYQLRYLARQAIRLRDGRAATRLLHRALRTHGRIALAEPVRTLATAGAAWLLYLLPQPLYRGVEAVANRIIGHLQVCWIGIQRRTSDAQALESSIPVGTAGAKS
jgi:glycosyltransferase involved in cell wall biosynthesis